MIKNPHSRREAGKMGEDIASLILTKNGYSLLCRNYTCPGGEIDLIVTKQNFLCFVEVKTRREGTQIPREAVDSTKLSRIKTAIDYFLNEFKDNIYVSSLTPRIDIMEIYTLKNTYRNYNHIIDIT